MCNISSDCERNPFEICVECLPEDKCNDPVNQGKCVHKALFPMFSIEIVGTLILQFFMALCIMSGIGGGGVTMPLI